MTTYCFICGPMSVYMEHGPECPMRPHAMQAHIDAGLPLGPEHVRWLTSENMRLRSESESRISNLIEFVRARRERLDHGLTHESRREKRAIDALIRSAGRF